MTRASPLELDAFYPIVPDASWVARLAPLGVRTLQLRFKSDNDTTCRQEIAASLTLAGLHNITLIINDHWQHAIELGATCVHLGQDDLRSADIASLKSSGLA
ncbi:MAG: thiamine phosphate synthase, partial [Alphaproteobacteria bacterium]|nr:thiamine phosphate synthase [Alphaproteobacteria bacterium]